MGQSCVLEAARSAAPRGARTGDGFGCDPLPRKQVVDAGPRAVGRVPGWVCAPKAVHQEVSAALIEREAAAPEARRSPSRAGFLLDPNLERETGFEPATLCLGSIIPYALCYRRGNKAKCCPVICSCTGLCGSVRNQGPWPIRRLIRSSRHLVSDSKRGCFSSRSWPNSGPSPEF